MKIALISFRKGKRVINDRDWFKVVKYSIILKKEFTGGGIICLF